MLLSSDKLSRIFELNVFFLLSLSGPIRIRANPFIFLASSLCFNRHSLVFRSRVLMSTWATMLKPSELPACSISSKSSIIAAVRL